jgi:uncharacterized protein
MDPVDRERFQELLAPELKKTLYVALISAKVSSEEMEPFAVEHLEYMAEVGKTGKIFASGAFPAPGAIIADGMVILATQTPEEARSIMDEEPFTKRGLRDYELRTWLLSEGKMTISLDASGSSYEFVSPS